MGSSGSYGDEYTELLSDVGANMDDYNKIIKFDWNRANSQNLTGKMSLIL